MLKFLLEKEFKQLLRGGMLPGILIMMPLMMMAATAAASPRQMRMVGKLTAIQANICAPPFLGLADYFTFTLTVSRSDSL